MEFILTFASSDKSLDSASNADATVFAASSSKTSPISQSIRAHKIKHPKIKHHLPNSPSAFDGFDVLEKELW